MARRGAHRSPGRETGRKCRLRLRESRAAPRRRRALRNRVWAPERAMRRRRSRPGSAERKREVHRNHQQAVDRQRYRPDREVERRTARPAEDRNRRRDLVADRNHRAVLAVRTGQERDQHPDQARYPTGPGHVRQEAETRRLSLHRLAGEMLIDRRPSSRPAGSPRSRAVVQPEEVPRNQAAERRSRPAGVAARMAKTRRLEAVRARAAEDCPHQEERRRASFLSAAASEPEQGCRPEKGREVRLRLGCRAVVRQRAEPCRARSSSTWCP